MKMYKYLVRPVFFIFPPETIHHFVFSAIRVVFKIPLLSWLVRNTYTSTQFSQKKNVFGIEFPNPVGLAAGFDKDANLVDELSCFGFGFIEIGTVTPVAQNGNPKPRMFRLPADKAIINRMGFNNKGVTEAARQLRKRQPRIVVGGNIGKNKNTPNEKAIEDYEMCFRELYDVVDYFVVNVSSPNTPGLRELQEKGPLKKILARLQEVNIELGESKLDVRSSNSSSSFRSRASARKPILLKIAPDLTNEQLDEIISIIFETQLDGVVATNTTLSRDHLRTTGAELDAIGAGGLSGKPLTRRATEVISYLHQRSNGKFSIIGVGGIHSPEDAIEKLNAGADLIQVYTGFIYEGPGLVKRINKAIQPSKN